MTAPEISTDAAAQVRQSRLAVVALLAVTVFWGSTFFLIKDLVVRVPVPDFLAVRFAICAVVLWLISPRSVVRLSPAARRQGAILGLIYGLAQILQTAGLEHTAASISGFVTGMYVVITPLLAAIFFRQRIGRMAWVAALLATLGLALLNGLGLSAKGLALGYGELLTLASAGLYALHIVALGRWTRAKDTMGLAVVQMLVITLVCGLAALPGGITVPSNGADWLSLLYMALFAGAFALVAQTWAQAHMTATRAAVIMCMEPVFAASFAVALGGESPSVTMIVGGGLILTAMYLAELRSSAHH